MTFFQDCSCESARAGMYELDNKSSIKPYNESRKNDGEGQKATTSLFFLTLMGCERKTSLSIVRVGGRGLLSHAILASYIYMWLFLGSSMPFYIAAAKLQFPHQRSNAVLPSLTFSSPPLPKENSIFDFCSLRFFLSLFVLTLLFY